ncbi:GntR family transcriptional regulator [Defluviimonas sp. SAOS-178_SWC]|uniref:GntR family transcriptional regulator n=1 Tax=Defluviimonas sp. SAOS-178_SWC TaxID=3121287 RepID=UPI003221BE28
MYVGKESVARPVAQICDRVWLSIAEKRLRPGTRLKEEELAEIFAVSRARVRQALAILEGDGLVTIVANRGAFVSEPTIQEARDIFYVRKLIEERIVERLIDHVTKDDISRLKAHLDEERSAAERGDTSASIRLSGGFHVLLAELCDSPFLFTVLRDLVSRSSLITAMYRVAREHYCGPDDHEGLIDAIRDRDAERARTAMRQHLEHVEAELNLEDDAPAVRDLRQALSAI